MRSLCRFILALIFAALTGAAIGSAQTGSKTKTIIVSVSPSEMCPIAMRAEHSTGIPTPLIVHRNSPRINQGIGQQLSLTLNNTANRAISEIVITAQGFMAKGRALPAQMLDSSTPESSETLNLQIAVGAKQSIDTDVWIQGLTTVRSIDLERVIYADGSQWSSSGPAVCRIQPDPVMLISQR